MKILGKRVDTLPKNTLWVSLLGTSLVATPASVVLAVLGIWVPGVGEELLATGALSLFVGAGTGITAACWIVDDTELNQYRRMGGEGRKEYHEMERAGRRQAAIARAEQAHRELELEIAKSNSRSDDDYWGNR